MSRWIIIRIRNASDKFAEINRTHSVFISQNRAAYEIMWKNRYCTAGQATDDNMAHEHCMLDNEGYRHTLRIRNTYRFSTTKVVTRSWCV